MKKFINFILVIFFIFLILLAYDNKDKIYIFYRDNILKVKDNKISLSKETLILKIMIIYMFKILIILLVKIIMIL